MTWAATSHGKKLHSIPSWEKVTQYPKQSLCGKRAKTLWSISTTITEKCPHCLKRLKRDK